MDEPGIRFPRWLMVVVLSLGAVTTTLNVTLLSPLLPHIAREFNVSDATAGQLGTLTAAAAAIVAILVTPLIDRYPRRLVLQLEAILLGVATVFAIIAPSFGILALSRALAGVGGAIIFGMCLATAADIYTDAAGRNRTVGIVSTAATLGTIIGLPALTQIAAVANWRMAIGMMVPLTVLLFAGTFVLPGCAPGPASAARPSWLGSYRLVLASRPTMLLLGLMTVLAAIWFAWFIYFGAFAQTAIGVSAGVLSALFFAGAAGELIGNNVGPMLLTRVPVRPLLLGTIALLALCLLGAGIINQPWLLFPFITVASLTNLALFLFVSILQLDTLPEARGGVMALNSASLEVGGALGIAAMGLILILFDGSYPVAYQTLGVVALLVLMPIAIAASSQRQATPTPEPVPTAAPEPEIAPLVEVLEHP